MSVTASINAQRLLERFVRYVQVGTAANPDSHHYPSSPGQLKLGRLLVRELLDIGLTDAHQDEHGLVWATVPASIPEAVPTVLFNAHLDTSPEAPGDNVQPQVIEHYGGGDIRLACEGRMIRVAECPELEDLAGHCLVTTDGSTLLGGDDKAGVAAIMELAQFLVENPHLPHGQVRILFTCDEEIGLGAKHMDLTKASAQAGYTLDGAGHCIVENENFSADQLTVRVNGYNIHPAIAKKRMLNASRGLVRLLAALPQDQLTPETTSDEEGFLHPYSMEGDVSFATCKILLRDFETDRLDDYTRLVQQAAKSVEEAMPGIQIEVNRSRQYRNMADSLARAPQVVEFARQAHESLGQTCKTGSIRGGTDGAMFSEMGMPTPNLSVGQHNIHSVLEFVSISEMVMAIEHAVRTLELWQRQARS